MTEKTIFRDRMTLTDFRHTTKEEQSAGMKSMIASGQTGGTVTVEVDVVKLWAKFGPRAIRSKSGKVTRANGAIRIIATDIRKV